MSATDRISVPPSRSVPEVPVPSTQSPTPHQAELDAYCRFMTEERGLAQATVTTVRSELRVGGDMQNCAVNILTIIRIYSSERLAMHFAKPILPWAFLIVITIPAASQEKDLDAAKRIQDNALKHSQIMDIVGYLTDVSGPRLTGSPNLRRAEEYARDKLRDWGVANAHLESWGPFGRGWSLEGFIANISSPSFSPLIAYPKAWSPGTNGTVRGEVVFLDVKTPEDLGKYKGRLKGKIVLFSPARHVDPLFTPPAQRRTDEELQRLANAAGSRRTGALPAFAGATGGGRPQLPKMAVDPKRRRCRGIGAVVSRRRNGLRHGSDCAVSLRCVV